MDVVAYIHGKGGCAAEAKHYKQLFASRNVIGLAYEGATPWDAGKEIHEAIATLKENYDSITLVANSIGAYFSMNADVERYITHAYFISPIVDMEKLITNMMGWAGVTEPELQERGSIRTDFGEDLSWEYLCFARRHPVKWSIPTDILKNILVYDDGIVKGMIHIEGAEIKELYVDWFFQGQGVGSVLIEHAKQNYPVSYLWAIEKNTDAIRFYEAHGFHLTNTKKYEEGTTEYLVMMEREHPVLPTGHKGAMQA